MVTCLTHILTSAGGDSVPRIYRVSGNNEYAFDPVRGQAVGFSLNSLIIRVKTCKVRLFPNRAGTSPDSKIKSN